MSQPYSSPPPVPASLQIPEMLQSSIALIGQPSNPPFGIVRGRGTLVMALAYVAIGALVTGIITWLLTLALSSVSNNLAWTPLLTYTLGFTAGFAAFVFFLASQLKLGLQARDDFAAAAALYWAPVVLVLTVLEIVLSRINFISLLTSVASAAQLLLLLALSLMALRSLFNLSFEQTLRAVGFGLLINSLVTSLVIRLIIEII
ncbi:MAG: hypothetical protein H0T53_09235 [Herpetosiphonaceae bacterium]|nr:hypothetical protein [Herpetosiphonaceae bacterium]